MNQDSLFDLNKYQEVNKENIDKIISEIERKAGIDKEIYTRLINGNWIYSEEPIKNNPEKYKKVKEDKLPEPKTEIKPKVKKVKKTEAEPLVQELDNTLNEIIEPVVEQVD